MEYCLKRLFYLKKECLIFTKQLNQRIKKCQR